MDRAEEIAAAIANVVKERNTSPEVLQFMIKESLITYAKEARGQMHIYTLEEAAMACDNRPHATAESLAFIIRDMKNETT